MSTIRTTWSKAYADNFEGIFRKKDSAPAQPSVINQAECACDIHEHCLKCSPDSFISDGFGTTWAKCCPMCLENTMEVVRPGKAQCTNCG